MKATCGFCGVCTCEIDDSIANIDLSHVRCVCGSCLSILSLEGTLRTGVCQRVSGSEIAEMQRSKLWRNLFRERHRQLMKQTTLRVRLPGDLAKHFSKPLTLQGNAKFDDPK